MIVSRETIMTEMTGLVFGQRVLVRVTEQGYCSGICMA